jgi:hypothetical protein
MINIGQMRSAHSKFVSALKTTVDNCAEQAAEYELANARQRLTVHRRTGRLSAETRTQVVRTANGRIVRLSNEARSRRGVGYASYVDRGNGTGYIYPRTAPFLRFRIGPLFIRAKRVRAYRGSLAFTKAHRSGFLYAGFLLRTQLASLARKF